MVKLLNKLFYFLKNLMLPILLSLTIYIIIYMFKRLEKEVFGDSLMEFLSVIAPFIILLILSIINAFLTQKNVTNNIFYNITSFIVMLVIGIFCYRALLDKNMYLWHKYGYNINFNYFADQIAPIKVMLYGLSFANVILMIDGYIKDNEVKEVKNKNKTKKVNKN